MPGENPSPTSDVVFRKVFGSEGNEGLLISLINSVEPRLRLTDVVIKNPFNLAAYKGSKESIVDIKAKGQDGTWFGIEVQMHGHNFYGKRAIFYVAKGYVDQLETGAQYSTLNTTIGMHFLGFKMFPDARMVRQFVFKDVETNEYSEQLKFLQLFFVEMGKLQIDWPQITTPCDCWIAYLRLGASLSRNNLPDALQAEPMIAKAVAELERMGADPELRAIYEAEEKARMAEVAELEWAVEQGMQRGQQHLLYSLMAHHIGDVPPNIVARLDTLRSNQLDELGKALFDLNSYAEVESWLSRQ